MATSTSSLRCINFLSPLLNNAILYFLETVIKIHVAIDARTATSMLWIVMEFVCITEPAKTGNMLHETIVVGLLWNLPSKSSKLYAKRKNPSAIPIGKSKGESKNA